MPKEQLIVSAILCGEETVDRTALEEQLREAIDRIAAEFHLTLRNGIVCVEDDLLGIAVSPPADDEDEIPFGPSPMTEPD
ncbi:MAG: hypothetical protein Greene041619_119 [Candidatus Peregrinibacteria bacterium Greene0416_19]|nr:MAG: hypothetical protein Greene041619_119 [Candidatus Peregrinibacteria bacterium Greene0416_19]